MTLSGEGEIRETWKVKIYKWKEGKETLIRSSILYGRVTLEGRGEDVDGKEGWWKENKK